MLDYNAALFRARQDAEAMARLQGYKLRYEYYHGQHRAMLPTKAGQQDDNVRINLARYIVDKGSAFLFGKDVEWQLQEGATTPEEEHLEAVWARNRKGTLLGKLATLGGIFGHTFIKILPDYYGPGLARFVLIDPEYVDVFWRGDDYENAWRYLISWEEQDDEGREQTRLQDVYLDDNGKYWHIVNRLRRGSGAEWLPDPNYPDVDWRYPWSPIIDCQNIPCPGAYYGMSDLEDLALQDTLNYVGSKINRILRYHSHPKTWGRGINAERLSVDTDEAILLGMSGELHNLEMQSDLTSSLGFLDRLQNMLMMLARVPNLTPENLAMGAQSGFALRILHTPLLEKTEMKRRAYGDMLIELNRRALELAGKGDDNICKLYWQDPLPLNMVEQMQNDQFEIDNKIAALSTIQGKRGYDPEVESERIRAEATERDVQEGNVGALLLRQFNQGIGV